LPLPLSFSDVGSCFPASRLLAPLAKLQIDKEILAVPDAPASDVDWDSPPNEEAAN
jgi:hypothetical protein